MKRPTLPRIPRPLWAAFVLVFPALLSLGQAQVGGTVTAQGVLHVHRTPNMDRSPALNSRVASHTTSRVHTPTVQPVDPLSYWHTQGNRIVNAVGTPVRLAAVNWGGMETGSYVPNGLAYQPLDRIMAQIASFGFNTVRLPFSNQMVEQNPIVESGLDANPSLKGRRALNILDEVVASARAHGLRIILDDQRSSAGVNPQGNGLWYTSQYPEASWLQDWRTLVRHFAGNPTVVGVDLRDEPHTGPPGPWSLSTYLHQGSTWGPYHGVETLHTDWRIAAQRGGDAVLAINPHLLVFVEGLQQYPDSQSSDGLDSYWWGGALQAARRFPVRLPVPHQLVYSPHEYGPQKYQMPFFGPDMTYASLSRVWERHWAFLLHRNGGTPVFVGEFGTCGTSPKCVSDVAPGSQGLWFRYWLRFLRRHPEIGWAYWSVNGTNSSGQDQPNYIFTQRWDRPRLPQLLAALRSIETTLSPNS